MQVRVIGQVEAVDADGSPLALGGPTQRRVLAALALRRNEVVSVHYLIDVVWPGDDVPARAEHNIRTYIHRLRTAVDKEGDGLETVGTGYRLRLDDEQLDAARFDRLAGTAARLADTGDAVTALDVIDEAEGLWRGTPFEEFAQEDWARPEVTRLDELHTTLRTCRAEALLDAGCAADSVAVLKRLVVDEPLRERPRALLMRALYESGRHAEALRAFQEFRRSLIDEIGVEPSKDLADLDRAIAAGALQTDGSRAKSVGGYELHERIGEGAFAVVHHATQVSLGREVAVKIIRAELANRAEFIRRFEAEAQMVARIEHPSVVPLYDYWREPDRAFLVMRWMTGGSLETRLDDGHWSLDDTVELVDQIAAALDAAHDRGVVHRDVKPENILFDDEGRAYLADFGIALDAHERAHPEAALSEGSPIFAAPEQLRREPAGPEADVHALAIVAYTLLVGRTPFADAPDEPTLLQRQLHEPIPPARDRQPDLPEGIDDVLSIATAKNPADRYPTASGFALAFRAAASFDGNRAEGPIAARPRANPYKGLRAFDEHDTADFYGRDRLIDELVGHLARPDVRMLAIVGPSGSGKSSVVRAGLVPALRAGAVPGSSRWFTTAMVPGTRPFEALETALLRVAVNPPAALLDQLRDGDRGILRAMTRIVAHDDDVVAIVVDQFEELFTGGTPESERDRFLRALVVAATEPASPVRIMITLRADFYDRPLRHPEFASLLKEHTVVVTPLAPDELEHAIVTPAATVGVGFESGLVAEIVADVNHEPGALPLLQYALTQVFDATDGDTITIEQYRAIGGLAGALGRRAEELFLAADDDERQSARRLFGRLVALGEGTEDTRRRAKLTELGNDTVAQAVLDRFGSARLVTFDRDPGSREPTVEIAHEAFIREWRRLREWLDEGRDGLRIHRHLTETALAWAASGRDVGELYRGGRLDAASTWAAGHDCDLNDAEREFLTASVAAHRAEEAAERKRFDEQVRSNRRLRTLVGVVTTFALLAGAFGAFALHQRSRAAEQAEAARAAEQQADVDRLVSRGRTASPADPTVDLLLAVEAHRVAPSFDTIDALHWALTARPGYVGSLDTGRIGDDITVLVDDRRLVTHTTDEVQIWDVAERRRIASLPTPPGATTAFEIHSTPSDDGTLIAAAGPGETLVHDVVRDQTIARIEHDAPATAVALSPDSTHIALGFGDGSTSIHLIDGTFVDGLEPSDTESPVHDLGWLPSGDELVVADERGVSKIRLADRQVVWRLPGPTAAVLLSADGNRVQVSMGPVDSFDDENAEFFVTVPMTLRTLDTDDGREISRIEQVDATRLAWSNDRETEVVGTSFTGSVSLFDLEAATVLRELGTGSGRSEAVGVLTELGLVAVAGTSTIELLTLDGSGPLSRFAPPPPEYKDLVDPFWTGSFDDLGRSLVTAILFEKGAARTYDLSSAALAPEELDVGEELSPFAIRRFGDHVLHATGPPRGLVVKDDANGQIVSEIGLVGGFRFALNPRGDLLATEQGDEEIVVIDVEEGRVRYRLSNVTEPGFEVPISEFTPDGRYLHVWNGASASRYDADSGDLIWSTDRWGYVFPGPDDEWVATAEADGSIELRDPTTLEPLGRRLVGHRGLVTQFYLDPDSRLAVTAADDGVARVWDTTVGRQLGRELPAITRSLRFFAPGGRLLALPGPAGYTIWDYDSEGWTDLACEVAGRNLTRDEWAAVGPRNVAYRATCEQYSMED